MSKSIVSRREFLWGAGTLCASSLLLGEGFQSKLGVSASTTLPPLVGLDLYEQNLNSVGTTFANFLANSTNPDDWGHTYYDSQRVFFKMADYTKDTKWNAAAQIAGNMYRDRYILPNNGGAAGWWIFAQGMAMDYLRTGDTSSKNAVDLLSRNASYANDFTDLEWTKTPDSCREVAYNAMSMMWAEKLGYPHRARKEDLIKQLYSHFDQAFVSQTYANVSPFYMMLGTEALIMHFYMTGDPQVLPAVKNAVDWLMANMWIPNEKTFQYHRLVDSDGGPTPAPDLNLIMLPAWGWVYNQTGDVKYINQGDLIFQGGVEKAYLILGKHFNQNYKWSTDYIYWRNVEPLVTKYDPFTGLPPVFVSSGSPVTPHEPPVDTPPNIDTPTNNNPGNNNPGSSSPANAGPNSPSHNNSNSNTFGSGRPDSNFYRRLQEIMTKPPRAQ